jgi:hypothetical protein
MSKQIPDDIDERLARMRGNILEALPSTRTHRFSRAGRVTILVAGSSLFAIALTGGTIAAIQASQEDVDYSVQCFEAASRSAESTTVVLAEATDNETGEIVPRDAIDPAETCGEMWRMGFLGQESAPADPNAANFPIPELVACVLDNGVGAVFPREDSTASSESFCRDLGLAVWD